MKISYGIENLELVKNHFHHTDYSKFYQITPFSQELDLRFLNNISQINQNVNQNELKKVLTEFSQIALLTNHFYGVKASELISKVGKNALTIAIQNYYILSRFTKRSERIIKANEKSENLEFVMGREKEYYLGYAFFKGDLIVFPRRIPKYYKKSDYLEYSKSLFDINQRSLRIYPTGMPKIQTASLVK